MISQSYWYNHWFYSILQLGASLLHNHSSLLLSAPSWRQHCSKSPLPTSGMRPLPVLRHVCCLLWLTFPIGTRRTKVRQNGTPTLGPTITAQGRVTHYTGWSKIKYPITRKSRYLYNARIFLHKVFHIYSSHMSSQVSLILLNLLNIWWSGAASKSMFDFR